MTKNGDQGIVGEAIAARELLALHGRSVFLPYEIDAAASSVVWDGDRLGGLVRLATPRGLLVVPFVVDAATGVATFHHEWAPVATDDRLLVMAALIERVEPDRGHRHAPPGEIWCAIDTNTYPGRDYLPERADTGAHLLTFAISDLRSRAKQRTEAGKRDGADLTCNLDTAATFPETSVPVLIVTSGIIAVVQNMPPTRLERGWREAAQR